MSQQTKGIVTKFFFLSTLVLAHIIPTAFAGAVKTTAAAGTSSFSSLSFSPTLKLEDTNPYVLLLQQYLNNSGYIINEIKGQPGSIGNETTKFGLKTKQALIRFQKDHNITPADGIFGPQTKAKMLEVASIATGDTSSGAVLGATTGTASGSGSGASGSGNRTPRYLYSLIVTKSGTGAQDSAVNITSSIAPAGANQPNMYLDHSVITLTPVPGSNTNFDGWSGAGLSGIGTKTFVMDGNKDITATFTKKTKRTLSVLPNGGDGEGSITVNNKPVVSGQVFYDGDIVTLTGTSDVGSKVGTWNVQGSNGSPNYTLRDSLVPDQVTSIDVTMNQNVVVSLPFNMAKYPFTISKAGTGDGNITTSQSTIIPYASNGYKGSFPVGTTVVITAKPANKSVFTGLIGNNVFCLTSPCTVITTDIDPAITAIFESTTPPATTVVTPTTGTTGTTGATPTKSTLTPYHLKINPSTGKGAGNVTATYKGVNYGIGDTITYYEGETVTITATPAPNSFFDRWGTDINPSFIFANPLIVPNHGDWAINADFSTDYTLKVNLKGLGSGEVYSGGGIMQSIDCGKKCQSLISSDSDIDLFANALPNTNLPGKPLSIFDHWEGDCTGNKTPCNVEMDRDRTVDAYFSVDNSVPSGKSPLPVIDPLLSDPVLPTPDPVPPTATPAATRLQIKTISALNTLVKKLNFFDVTNKSNFIKNATAIIKNNQTLNLVFSTAKDSGSIASYDTKKTYLEDNAYVSSKTCTKTESITQTSATAIPITSPQTPLLNDAKDGICGLIAVAYSLITTLNLPAPDGTLGKTTHYFSSSAFGEVWSIYFLEYLAQLSGETLKGGISQTAALNIYKNYLHKVYPNYKTTVKTQNFGGGSPTTNPTHPVPIKSSKQDDLLALIAGGNADCQIKITSHTSHIRKASKTVKNNITYLKLDTENNLNQGPYSHGDSSNYNDSPFEITPLTSLYLDPNGNITATGAESGPGGEWRDPNDLASFHIVCYVVTGLPH